MKHKFLDGLTRPGRGFQPPVNPNKHGPVGFQNRVQMDLIGPGGEVKSHHEAVGNIMCTYGLSKLVSLLAGGALNCSDWIQGMRIGTDITAAASTDISLLASTGVVTITAAGDVIEAGARTLRCIATFASSQPAGAAQVREIGLFNSSAVGSTFAIARKELTGAASVNKGISDSINVSYDIVFTTA